MLAPTLNPCQPSCAPYKLCAPYVESYSRPSQYTPSVKSVLKNIDEYVDTHAFASIYSGQVFTGDDLRGARLAAKSHLIYCEIFEVAQMNLPFMKQINIFEELIAAAPIPIPENDTLVVKSFLESIHGYVDKNEFCSYSTDQVFTRDDLRVAKYEMKSYFICGEIGKVAKNNRLHPIEKMNIFKQLIGVVAPDNNGKIKETPVKETPVKETPVKETPVKETPAPGSRLSRFYNALMGQQGSGAVSK